MQPASLHDLLLLDHAIKKPNAYQIFGLDGSETDREIGMAIGSTCERLKKHQATCEPKTWQQAARLVTAARQVLEDPQQRAQLDRKLSAISPEKGAESSPEEELALDSGPESADPLAGLLPDSNPLQQTSAPKPSKPGTESATSSAASVLGLAAPRSETADEPSKPAEASILGTPPIGTPPASQEVKRPIVTSESAKEGVNWTPPSKSRKRKKKKSGLLAFTAIIVLLLGGIVFLLDRLSKGERLAVNENGVPTNVETVSERSESPKPIARPVGDGIMPASASGGIAPNLKEKSQQASSLVPPGGFEFADGKTPDALKDPMASDGMEDSGAEAPAPPPAMNPNLRDPFAMTTPPAETPQETMTDEMPSASMNEDESDAKAVEAAKQMIAETEKLITSADWDSMKASADALLKLELTPEQFKRASTLYDIADLASYFRGAIIRGASSVQVGNDFEVVDGFRVIVVEVTPTEITVQYNKRQKTHSIEKLPPTLQERFASFQLDLEAPDSRAGMALFRLIDPATNQDYKAEAIKMLETLGGQLDKVDSENLLAVAKEILL